MFVIILAAITPLILFLTQGYLPSISSYWETPMQPIFIITNASTSYHLYGIRNWRLSAFLLLFLTAFSVTDFALIHNIVAVFFFIICIYPLYVSRYYKWIVWTYIASLPVMIYSMFLGESLAVISLCLYHALILVKIKRFASR
jgi:hypothetical protein